jgi:hypothetical protein
MLIHVVCRGRTPLFMNRMSESTLEGLRTKTKPPKTASIGTRRTPRDEAAEKVYEHGGKPYIPGENLMSCLIGAGVFIRLDAKRQLSTARSTLLPGIFTLLTPRLDLVVPDTHKAATWEADVRKGTNPNGGEAIAICRPRFDSWAFEFDAELDEAEIGENVIRELVDKAGKRMGLGDFRPSRKGIFGQFLVEKWERRKEDPSYAAAE